MRNRTMRLNYHGNWAGSHQGAWKAKSNTQAEFDLDYYLKFAQIAERGLFDGIFYAADLAAQGPNRPTYAGLNPVVLSAALAMHMERIGLAATISTTFNEPFNVAKAMATFEDTTGTVKNRWVYLNEERALEIVSAGYGADRLLVEPTKFESRVSLDRFIAALAGLAERAGAE